VDPQGQGQDGLGRSVQEQYEALKEAIDNWHQTQEILQRMQALSRHVIFEMLPNPLRRKRLGKRVLGLI
jgi:DNA-binding transcriptional regulator GbsR (MarR family)